MKRQVMLCAALFALGMLPWGGGAGLVLEGQALAAENTPPARRDSLLLDVGEVLDDFLSAEPYLYQSAGARDPFRSLMASEGGPVGDGLPGVEDLIVVGILWGEKDRFALIETCRGRNMILRKGDAIRYGRVIDVFPDGLRVRYSYYGVVRILTLPIVSGVEDKDER